MAAISDFDLVAVLQDSESRFWQIVFDMREGISEEKGQKDQDQISLVELADVAMKARGNQIAGSPT